MATRRQDAGAVEGSPAKATRGKRATSSTATGTPPSQPNTGPATSEPAHEPDRVTGSSGLKATDVRVALEALRDQLADALVAADVAVKAQIAGQYRAVVKDLAALGAADDEGDLIDELAARRAAARVSKASRRDRAAGDLQ